MFVILLTSPCSTELFPAGAASLSIRQGEPRLHVTHIEHHPGQPDQEGDHTGDRSNLCGAAQENFERADLFHWRPLLQDPV